MALLFYTRGCSNSQNFFSRLSATLHMQKKIKEIAYILTSFQALLKAELFFYHLYSQNKTIKWKYNFYLFVSFFIDTTLK